SDEVGGAGVGVAEREHGDAARRPVRGGVGEAGFPAQHQIQAAGHPRPGGRFVGGRGGGDAAQVDLGGAQGGVLDVVVSGGGGGTVQQLGVADRPVPRRDRQQRAGARAGGVGVDQQHPASGGGEGFGERGGETVAVPTTDGGDEQRGGGFRHPGAQRPQAGGLPGPAEIDEAEHRHIERFEVLDPTRTTGEPFQQVGGHGAEQQTTDRARGQQGGAATTVGFGRQFGPVDNRHPRRRGGGDLDGLEIVDERTHLRHHLVGD